MDTMHNWALWRFLMITVIALPFLVAALLHGLRKQRRDASVIGATSVEKTQVRTIAATPISGPGAWRVAGETRHPESHGNDGAPVVDKRAA